MLIRLTYYITMLVKEKNTSINFFEILMSVFLTCYLHKPFDGKIYPIIR